MKEIHQIWNGDSRELASRFKPGRIDCIITDPPFGINNLSKHAVTESGMREARKIAGDSSVEEALALFDEVFRALHFALKDTADIYIFTSYQVLAEWIIYCDDLIGGFGYKRKSILVWEKEGPGMGDLNSPWSVSAEFILFYQRGRERSAPRVNSVIRYPQVASGKLIHPHEKPLVLLERLIKTSTSPGEFLVDPFAGSGSLVRAAKLTGRSCVGIEYDETNAKRAQAALLDQGDAMF